MNVTNIFEYLNSYREQAPVDVEGAIKGLGIRLIYDSLDDDISGSIEKMDRGRYLIQVNEK